MLGRQLNELVKLNWSKSFSFWSSGRKKLQWNLGLFLRVNHTRFGAAGFIWAPWNRWWWTEARLHLHARFITRYLKTSALLLKVWTSGGSLVWDAGITKVPTGCSTWTHIYPEPMWRCHKWGYRSDQAQCGADGGMQGRQTQKGTVKYPVSSGCYGTLRDNYRDVLPVWWVVSFFVQFHIRVSPRFLFLYLFISFHFISYHSYPLGFSSPAAPVVLS